eukprot:4349176-Prymnesium_polylepis.2
MTLTDDSLRRTSRGKCFGAAARVYDTNATRQIITGPNSLRLRISRSPRLSTSMTSISMAIIMPYVYARMRRGKVKKSEMLSQCSMWSSSVSPSAGPGGSSWSISSVSLLSSSD